MEPYVMPLAQWLEDTKRGILKPRSGELKHVDAALKNYHAKKSPEARKALARAIEIWLAKKGANWKNNERNKNHAVENLRKQVAGITDANDAVLKDLAELPFFGLEAQADEDGRQAIREARKALLATLFQGKKLQLKSEVKKQMAQETIGYVSTAKVGASAIATKVGAAKHGVSDAIASTSAWQFVKNVVQDAFPDLGYEQASSVIGKQLSEHFLADLAGSLVPFFGVAKSGAQTVSAATQAIVAVYRAKQVKSHYVGVLAGDPYAAAVAIKRLIDRERNTHSRNAMISGATMGGRALLLAFPAAEAVGGPVLGAAEAIAKLSHMIYLVARDYYEAKGANKAMQNAATLDSHVFEVCPVLGCYLLLCGNDSDVVNMLVEDFGRIGWMDDVEKLMKNHVRPLREQARRLVSESRYQIAGLSGFAHVRPEKSKLDGLKKIWDKLEKVETAGDVIEALG